MARAWPGYGAERLCSVDSTSSGARPPPAVSSASSHRLHRAWDARLHHLVSLRQLWELTSLPHYLSPNPRFQGPRQQLHLPQMWPLQYFILRLLLQDLRLQPKLIWRGILQGWSQCINLRSKSSPSTSRSSPPTYNGWKVKSPLF